MKVTGNQIGTGTFSNLTINLAGEFSEVIPLASEKEGDNLYTAVFNTIYDTVGAAVLSAQCTTNVATI
jgi:hypothetical protein